MEWYNPKHSLAVRFDAKEKKIIAEAVKKQRGKSIKEWRFGRLFIKQWEDIKQYTVWHLSPDSLSELRSLLIEMCRNEDNELSDYMCNFVDGIEYILYKDYYDSAE